MNSGIPITQLTAAPFVVTIPTSQWSSGDGDYYITVQATNITQDSILIPAYDHDSESVLKGPIWCVPDDGSFTIHTSVLPSGAVTILVQFIGVVGEAQYQVLADVYSKDQAVAKTDIVNNLTSTSTTAPLSAAQGKALNDKLEAEISLPSGYSAPDNNKVYKVGKVVHFSVALTIPAWTTKRLSINGLIPSGFTPSIETNFAGIDNTNDIVVSCLIESNGDLRIFRSHTTSCTSLRLGVTYLT